MKNYKSQIQSIIKSELGIDKLPAKDIVIVKEPLEVRYRMYIEIDQFSSSDMTILRLAFSKINGFFAVIFDVDMIKKQIKLVLWFNRMAVIDNDLKLNDLPIQDFTNEILKATVKQVKLNNYQMSVLTGLSTATVSLHMSNKRKLDYKHQISYLTGIRRYLETGRVQNEIGKHYKRK